MSSSPYGGNISTMYLLSGAVSEHAAGASNLGRRSLIMRASFWATPAWTTELAGPKPKLAPSMARSKL
jgi:hypothetical protein